MRDLAVPLALLALLLGGALWTASAVEADIAPWCEAIERAEAMAAREDWDGAADTVRAAHAGWEARHPFFHMVTAHGELDRADAHFAAAERYAAARETGAFRAELAELAVQLRAAAEMQRLSIRNIF